MRRHSAVAVLVAALCLMPAARLLAAEAQPGVAEGMLRFAPAGAWGLVCADADALLSSPAFKDVHLQASPQSSIPDFYSISAVGVYVLPAEAPLTAAPPWCAVFVLKAGARPGIEERMAPGTQRQDVEGLSAYVSSRAALAFGDDTTLLVARDKESLATLVRAWRVADKAGLGKPLQDAVAPVAKNVVFAAVALPEPLEKMMSAEQAQNLPPTLVGATRANAGLALGDKATLTVTLRLASPENAQQAGAAVDGQVKMTSQRLHMMLQQANERMRPSLEPIALIYDNLQVAADGPNLRISLSLNQADVPKATQAIVGALMGARAAAQAAAGAQGAPAPSGPPAGGQ